MSLHDQIMKELEKVVDPELDINVVDLGLIYKVEIDNDHHVIVDMTLTTPGCPLHDSITKGVQYTIEAMEEVKSVKVNLVWEPEWTPDRMSPRARGWLGA